MITASQMPVSGDGSITLVNDMFALNDTSVKRLCLSSNMVL